MEERGATILAPGRTTQDLGHLSPSQSTSHPGSFLLVFLLLVPHRIQCMGCLDWA